MTLLAAALTTAFLFFLYSGSAVAVTKAVKAPSHAHWGIQVLTEAICHGLLLGYPGGEIEPDRLCSRAEFSAMLVRFLKEEKRAEVYTRLMPLFSDLPLDHWAKGYMELLNEMGIVKGDTANRALPDKLISRQEAVALLQRAISTEGVSASGREPLLFSDEDQIAPWAMDSFRMLSALGIVVGDGGKVRPKDTLTRAEAAALVVRGMDVLGKRYDLKGQVVEVQKTAGSLMVSCQGTLVAVKLDGAALVFDGEKSINLASVKQGDFLGVIFDRETGLAKVLSLIAR